MPETISETFTVGVFQNVEWARRGIDALFRDGFAPHMLTVVASDTPEAAALIEETLGQAPDRLNLKSLNAVVAKGPMLAALEGSDQALTSEGLAPTMRRAGFQRHDGYIFEALVGRGGVLVAVREERRAADALAVLHSYGGGNAAIGAWSGRV